MSEKTKFVKLRLKDGIGRISIDVNDISSYYDKDIVYGEVRLKDGTIYKVWENANMIEYAINQLNK